MRLTDAAVLIFFLALVWSFYQAHRDPHNHFSIFDLVMDGGRVSKMAVVFMGSFATLTWIMVRLTIDGKMNEGYFTSYGAVCFAPLIAKMFSTQQASSMTTTTSTTQEVK